MSPMRRFPALLASIAAPSLLPLAMAAVPLEETCENMSLLQHGLEHVVAIGREPYTQQLTNDGDISYFGNISVGGQVVNGIFDTGSFELVVLSTACKICFATGPVYDPHKSETHQLSATAVNAHMYGSGLVIDRKAYDVVSVGDGEFATGQFGFWEVTGHLMPIMIGARFGAIVGMGRKGTVASVLTNGTEVSLLEAMSPPMDRFSVCFGREPLSPGFWTWDAPPALSSAVELNVIGNVHWGLKLTNVRLPHSGHGSEGALIGCAEGCAAVLDTGTTLIGAPRAALANLSKAIGRLDPECKNLDDLPDLHFELDGQAFALPPSSYVGFVEGLVNPTIKDVLYFKPGPKCQPLFIAVDGPNTQYGPLWIVGMPFFREYHTTFESKRPAEPANGASMDAIFVSPADDHCGPSGGSLLATGRPRRRSPLRLDASKLRLPSWLHEGSWSYDGPAQGGLRKL